MPALRPHPDLPSWYESSGERQEFVNDLFDRTARHYDAVCQVMSFGTGRWYRRDALRRAGLQPGMRLLDVATGTGQVLRGALDLGLAAGDVVGVDPSLGMLHENRRHHRSPLLRGLGERLPFGDESFDFVSMGYALRHVPDLEQTFREYHRVLRRGGKVLLLEITKPASRVGALFTRAYMKTVVPILARLRSRDTAALMRYYWDTIDACVPPTTILDALGRSGFQGVGRKVKQGILSEYHATKA